LSFKKVFNVSLIITCCTIGVIGAIKKHKIVFLTKSGIVAPPKLTPDTHEDVAYTESVQKTEEPKSQPRLANLPEVDRINQLFNVGQNKLPIVQTVTFSPKVTWLEGRLAWIADYASHFKTSRHFIARSMNGKADYFSQNVSTGTKFNVYNPQRPFDFHMVIDTSSCQLALYYHDELTDERVLLKTYKAGLGRKDDSKSSGLLTPHGKFKIGGKIAIYKPGTMGTFQDKKVEMIRVFGTRWMPFEGLEDDKSQTSKGIGLHGLPWQDSEDGLHLEENLSSIGNYSSDGCIRLANADVEELFAVVISKPCYVHIVDNILNAELPGREVVTPTH